MIHRNSYRPRICRVFPFYPVAASPATRVILFLNPAIDQILARFREQYDYVLIDSCPMFAADDTSTLAPKADGVLFVVRSRFSHARVVREALELLFHRQARVLGLILNRADSSPTSYAYYKYAEYYSSANAAEADKFS